MSLRKRKSIETVAQQQDGDEPPHEAHGWGRVKDTALSEYQTSESKRRKRVAGAALAITQLLDRVRVVVLVVPPTVINVMEHTNNSVLAGAVGAGMFAAWSAIVGESTLQGLQEFPESVASFEQEYPNFVGFFADALPGVERGGPSATHEQSVGSKIGTHVRRSGSSVSLGTSPFVATAQATGYEPAQSRRLYAETAADGSALVFGIAAGATEGIKRLALAGHYRAAQNIQNVVGDNRLWWGIAAASIGAEYVANKRKRTQQDETPTES